MIMPSWVGVAGILVAIAIIIVLAMKGYSIVFIAPLASIIVMLTNNMDLYTATISGPTSFMMNLSKYVINYFAVFLLGSILAKYIEESGAATSIAKTVLKITGTEKPFSVLIALFIIAAILTYGGISLFVVIFAIVPLARPIFKEMNMAWNLMIIPTFLGMATITMTMLPGAPSIQNVIPTAILKTTLTAAPLLGIAGSIGALAFGFWYMKYELNKSIKNGENYSTYDTVDSVEEVKVDVKLPSILLSILPLIVLIIIILIGSSMKVPNIILIGLIIAILLSAIFFNGFIKSHKAVINTGSQGAVVPIFLTAAAVGFGGVITAAPAFKTISAVILGIPGHPLISLSVATIVMAVITGSASGTISIILTTFGQNYIAMGIDPEVIHRITAVASAVLTNTPHSGVVLSFFALSGLNHKNGFKYLFNLMFGANAVALIVMLLLNIALGLK